MYTEECGIAIEEGNEQSSRLENTDRLSCLNSGLRGQPSWASFALTDRRCHATRWCKKWRYSRSACQSRNSTWQPCDRSVREIAESLDRPVSLVLLDEHRRIKLSTVLRQVFANSFVIHSMRKVLWKFTPRRLFLVDLFLLYVQLSGTRSSFDYFQRLRKAVPMSFKWPISNRMPISLNRLNSTNKWPLLLISARSTPSEQVQTPFSSFDRTKDACFSRSFSCRRFEYSPAFDWIRRSRSRNGLQLSLPRSCRYHRRSVYTNLQGSEGTVGWNRCPPFWHALASFRFTTEIAIINKQFPCEPFEFVEPA